MIVSSFMHTGRGLFQLAFVFTNIMLAAFFGLCRFQPYKYVFVAAYEGKQILQLFQKQILDYLVANLMRGAGTLDFSITGADHVFLLLHGGGT